MKGYKVLIVPVSEMLHNLNAANDFFEIISKRYEKGSLIINTNKSFKQWGDIFTDNILASTILDRVVHYSTIIKINSPIFRAKDFKKGGDKL